MLIIRLMKVGKKNSQSFRLVVTEKTNASQSGRFLELLGNYDPRKKVQGKKSLNLKAERIKYWLSQGAQVSDTAFNLLVGAKIVDGPKRKIKIHLKKNAEADAAKEPEKPSESNGAEAKPAEAAGPEKSAENPETKEKAPADKPVEAEK